MGEAVNLVLLCPRLQHLRHLGPIATAAKLSWRVAFFCPTGGPKDDAATHLGIVEREGGGPAVEVTGATELVDMLVLAKADAVIAVGLRMPPWIRQHVMPQTRARGIRWVSVGYLAEELLQVLEDGPALLGEWDVATTASWEALDWCAERLAVLRSRAAAAEARRRFVAVGYPALDPLARLNRDWCRTKHGIKGRALLFVPAARPHLMPRWRHAAFRGGLRWLAPALGLPTYWQVCAAVVRYARRHDAQIIIKTRAKKPDPSWLPHMGQVFGDTTYHPSTTLELVKAADGYCGFASAFAVEATAARLHQTHVLAWPPKAAEHPLLLDFRERFFLGDGPWERPGVAQALHLYRRPESLWTWAENAPWLGERDPAICARALAPVVGEVNGKASERLLDAIDRVS